jgi:hypothetical protein
MTPHSKTQKPKYEAAVSGLKEAPLRGLQHIGWEKHTLAHLSSSLADKYIHIEDIQTDRQTEIQIKTYIHKNIQTCIHKYTIT